MVERLFKLRANGTTVGREVRGGIVTFLTLSYILFVQPAILENAIHAPPKPEALAALVPGQGVPLDLQSLQTEYDAAMARHKQDVDNFRDGVFVATCVGSAVACLLMAFLANYPFALAPAMGHNVFFAFTV